jgi:hypothetical protein
MIVAGRGKTIVNILHGLRWKLHLFQPENNIDREWMNKPKSQVYHL